MALQFADAGAYSVVISNQHGTATSDDALLSVGYTLTVRSTGRGEVERDLDLSLYPSNAVVHLTALPQPGRSFLGWTGAISGTANPVTLVLRSNTQVTAMFEVALGDIKWHSDFGDAPALGTNGQLYAFSEGFVVSLDAADGKTVFKGSYFDSWWAPGAIGADGTLYIGNYSGSSVWAHDGSTGEQYWGFNIGICVHACPAIGVDGTLYLAGANLYAVDPDTHLQKWSFVGGDIFESSPALSADGILYAGCYDGKMYALNARTGEMLWEFVTGGAIHSSPALGSDGSVCFGSRDGNVYSVDGSTGQKRWEFPTGDAVEASPVIGPDGCVYISSTDSSVYALEGHTGVQRWRTAGDGSSTAALAADGTLYVGRNALSSRNGELLWELAAGGGTPTIGPDGTVYSGGYALHGTSPLADGPWPKFHRTLDNCGRAPARPILDGIRSRLTNEGFELIVHCERGDAVAIEYTSNLQNWTWLRSLTNTTGTLRFLDPGAAADGQRFYRVATTNPL